MKKNVTIAMKMAFVLYLGLLIYFMFLSEHYGRTTIAENYRYNLIPFREISRYLQWKNYFSFEFFFLNIYGNILAFLPFGFLVPIISSKDRHFWSVFLLSFELTLTLETMQLILKVGSFDVDDIILNVTGGAIGYLLYMATGKVVRKLWLSTEK